VWWFGEGLAAIDRDAAVVLAGRGLAASIALAAALTLIAVGVYLPRPAARAALVLAIVAATAIWVFGEAFGAIFTGTAIARPPAAIASRPDQSEPIIPNEIVAPSHRRGVCLSWRRRPPGPG
jgi:hypothetical protein